MNILKSMEIVSLITKIGLQVKNMGRPIVPHLEEAILKLNSRKKHLCLIL